MTPPLFSLSLSPFLSLPHSLLWVAGVNSRKAWCSVAASLVSLRAIKGGWRPGALASDRRLYQRQRRALFTAPINTHSVTEIKRQWVLWQTFARKHVTGTHSRRQASADARIQSRTMAHRLLKSGHMFSATRLYLPYFWLTCLFEAWIL